MRRFFNLSSHNCIQPYVSLAYRNFDSAIGSHAMYYEAVHLNGRNRSFCRNTPLRIIPCSVSLWLIAYNPDGSHIFLTANGPDTFTDIDISAYDTCIIIIFDDIIPCTGYGNRTVQKNGSIFQNRLPKPIIQPLTDTSSFVQRLNFFENLLHPYCCFNNSAAKNFPAESELDKSTPGLVKEIKQMILDSGGFSTLKDLSAATGYCSRHINRVFTEWYGFGPKQYSKCVRFSKILGEIFDDPHRSNSAFIQNSAYSDQAHFQREFKHFMGETPKEFIKRLTEK